jgi:gliding motility-associated-like protein
MKKLLLALLIPFFFVQYSTAQPCVGSQSLTANPPPSGTGTYQVGTVVTFCYSVSNYSQTGADWIAGVVPTIGPAWVASSLTPVTTPASCDGQGQWGWYTSCTGTASGQTFGPGFYYDSPAGSTSGVLDGVPGNNYGDNCQNNTWTFCFSLEVGQCTGGGSGSLYVGVQSLSDYTAGSWGTNACIDPPYSYGNITCANACALVVASVTIVDATCHNTNDGSITPVPNGTAPYTYQWSNGAITQTNSNLAPGIYTLTVTDSAGCTKTVTFPVGGPQPIVLNETVTDNGCNTNGGSIVLAPSGGTGATYTYLWSDGSTGSLLTNLQGGTYTVTVTDTNNCTQAGTYTISTVVPFVNTASVVDAGCSGSTGSASINSTGGVAPYTYLWSNGANTSSVSNLNPGIYTVTVSDAGQCDTTISITINGTTPVVLNESVIDNNCTEAAGTIALAPTGGAGSGYTYIWSNGASTSVINNLPGGTYTVTVTDPNGCSNTGTFNITTFIPIVLSTTSTITSCGGNDGTATATVSGGALPYTYDWQPTGGAGAIASNLPAGTYTVLVTDGAGCTSSSSVVVQSIPTFTLSTTFVPLGCDPLGTTTATVAVASGTAPFNYQWQPTGGNQATATGLNSGTYTVIVTDANGCIDSSSVTIPGVVPVTLTTTNAPVQCNQPNSGTASVNASGGNSPYTYLWSNGSTSGIISGLSGGTYTVTVTDASGCTATDVVTINVIPDVVASAGTGQTVCNGTAVNLTGSATGGTSPFSFSWDNGASNANQTVTPTATTTYVLTVTDANSCNSTSSVTVTVVDYPNVTVSSNTDICYGSSTSLQASGGSTYSWTPSSGLSDSGIANPVANPTATTTYTVTVSNGSCSSTGTVTITVAPEILSSFTSDTTAGQAPLTVEFTNTTSGANSYLWDFGDGNTSTDTDPTHIYVEQGSYEVVLIAYNSNGCSDTVRFAFIVVDSESAIVIPNVFTPNGDNFNDTFHFQELGIKSVNTVILNRWGREVYSWNKTDGSWNGKSKDGSELPDGVYIYIVKAEGINGKVYNLEGSVHLIRAEK